MQVLHEVLLAFRVRLTSHPGPPCLKMLSAAGGPPADYPVYWVYQYPSWEGPTVTTLSPAELALALAEPFPQNEVKFKPQSVKGNRCMALAYIDARHVMDRLDAVMGLGNWRDEYTILNDGSVQCRLSLRIGGEWVYHEDVGSRSEQPDEGDKMKSAFSDSLKRAAVKFGIGRYLYRLGHEWVDYDPQKRQLARPALPNWALPYPPKKKPAPQEPDPNLPKDGAELHKRLRDYDAKLAAEKVCSLGALLVYVADCGVKAGFQDDIAQWNGQVAIRYAIATTKQFEATARANLKEPSPATGHQPATAA